MNILKTPTINLAIGPNCPVRCEGCYNHFGNTHEKENTLVKPYEVSDFIDNIVEATQDKIKITVSGGDPLHHPEITSILRDLRSKPVEEIKLDTVGSAFLAAPRIIFKGRGIATRIQPQTITPFVDSISLPLDGATQDSIESFRKGRRNLLRETYMLSEILKDLDMDFGFNTVVHSSNISEMQQIHDLARDLGAKTWQAFEYDPKGPNPSRSKDELTLRPSEFDQAVKSLIVSTTEMEVACKSLQRRQGAYFLIDDSGFAWQPNGNSSRKTIGHITNDKEKVIYEWMNHITKLEMDRVQA